jgi:hypothetical protein
MVKAFYVRWIVANSWSEGAGLSATLLLGFVVASRLEVQLDPLAIIAGAAIAVALGAVLEGVLVGWAQGRIIHRYVRDISVRRWTVATAVGAGAAWLLGMVPSTIMNLVRADSGISAGPAEPSAFAQYGLAIAMGVVLGVVLALPQMLVLRRVARQPGGWLLANALAWAIGMPLIFAGMETLPWEGPRLLLAAGVAVICVAVGGAVGAVHGVFLCRILPLRAARGT